MLRRYLRKAGDGDPLDLQVCQWPTSLRLQGVEGFGDVLDNRGLVLLATASGSGLEVRLAGLLHVLVAVGGVGLGVIALNGGLLHVLGLEVVAPT